MGLALGTEVAFGCVERLPVDRGEEEALDSTAIGDNDTKMGFPGKFDLAGGDIWVLKGVEPLLVDRGEELKVLDSSATGRGEIKMGFREAVGGFFVL